MFTLANLMDDLRAALHPAPPCEEACNKTCEILKRYSENKIQLPEHLRRSESSCYARHLIHRQDEDGFCVVAMVWGPGQGTPVHDHGGTWCVEGCVEGQLAITSYRLLDPADSARVRFAKESCIEVARGAVGCLIPPFEHHKIENPFSRQAITIHVYGQELRNCTRYLAETDDTYRPEKVALCYSSTPA